jgi:indolepyruvate ferredoxin oxidoreductase alpha subunit
LLQQLAALAPTILVIEEGYPMVESALKGILPAAFSIKGRLDGTLPRSGELNPDLVGAALGLPVKTKVEVDSVVKNRPPSLCVGCGHRDLFEALHQVYADRQEEMRIFGDIGCYTLGFLPPYQALHACVDMGASISMAKGAADAGLKYSVAVIGDSTFTHSGMTSLMDAINSRANITVIISDNETTAMTGGQPSAGTGRLESICLRLGIAAEHLHVITPHKKNQAAMADLIRRELEYPDVSVIIPRRECVQTHSRKTRTK